MRICIFGAGAVGSHFAVRLALAGHEVSCVMRGPHLEAVKAKGLTLRVGDAEFSADVKASDDPSALGPQDVVISTLKATGVSALATGLRAIAARRHRCGFRPERHSLVVRYRAWPRSSAAARSRLSRSGRTPARRGPERAHRRRRDLFVERNRRARCRRQSHARPQHIAGRRMRRSQERADRAAPGSTRRRFDYLTAGHADQGNDLDQAPDQHVDVGAVPGDRADRAGGAGRC